MPVLVAPSPCKLEIPVDHDFLPVVGSYLGALASCYGVPTESREPFEHVTVALVKLIMDRAFSPGDLASISISVVPTAGGLEIVIHDQGLPVDPDKWTTDGASDVMKAVRDFMDQVRFLNLGPQGHQTRLVKYFNRLILEAEYGGQATVPDSTSPLEIRRLRPGEGLQVSRCVYRCYGYSYGALEAAYYPERMEALNESHEILSLVAVTPDGEVAGHLALERSGVDYKLATAGVAAVLPAFRSRGLAQRMTVEIMEEAARQGVEEIQAFAVTSHPYSQKLAHAFGFKSFGIYLATAFFNFKGIAEEGAQRETLLGLYRNLGRPEIVENVYAPTRHRPMIEALVQHVGRPVAFLEGEGVLKGEPSVIVRESPIRNLAKIHIANFGQGWLEQVRQHVRYLRQHDYRQFILSLPMNKPMAAEAVRPLEKLGFFFSGLTVREEGLCIVLQYLHGVTLDYAKIQVVDPMAKELLSYVRILDPGRI